MSIYAFIYSQVGSTNDVDNSATSDNAAQDNDTTSRNQDTLERLVEMVDALLMKEADEIDLEATGNDQIIV